MKPSTLCLCGSLALALVGAAPAAQYVNVYGRAYTNGDTLVLQVYADSTVPLRSFGIRIGFDPDCVQLQSVASNAFLWFLAAQPGQRSDYTASQTAPDAVRLIGARFQGNQPAQGVGGTELLLAVLTFNRMNAELPMFQLDLAGPAAYTSFVAVDGSNMDGAVAGLGTLALSFQTLPGDSNRNGIPDDIELAWFGNLSTATATSDSDGDGQKDFDEWICGTSAADSNSVTQLGISIDAGSNRLVRWEGQAARVYDLLWSGDLTNLAPIVEGLTPEHPNAILDGRIIDKGFYRLRIHWPSAGL